MRRPTRNALVTVAALLASAVGLITPAAARAATAAPTLLAQSVTWLSPEQGWVLGGVDCGQEQKCTDVVTTNDSGTTWQRVGRAGPPLAVFGEPAIPGVAEIRFADADHGWEYGPSVLYASADAGKTWQPQVLPGSGQRLLSFAAGPSAAYVLVLNCSYNKPLSNCRHPATLWRMPTGGETWTFVPIALPIADFGVVKVLGSDVYVVASPTEALTDALYASTDDGLTFSSRPSPCLTNGDDVLDDVAPIVDGQVALLCVGDPGFSKSVKTVFLSKDAGLTTIAAGMAGLDGIQSQLAAAPVAKGALVVASWSDGSFTFQRTPHQDWTEEIAFGDGGAGWNDLIFTTPTTAYTVYGPAEKVQPAGMLVVTHDAGLTWAPMPLEITG